MANFVIDKNIETYLLKRTIDYIDHPWLYDFRAAFLLEMGKLEVPHDPKKCKKCNV